MGRWETWQLMLICYPTIAGVLAFVPPDATIAGKMLVVVACMILFLTPHMITIPKVGNKTEES